MSLRKAKITGWVLFGLTSVLSVPALLIAATNPAPAIRVRPALESQTSFELVAIAFVVFMTFSLVGAVIVSKRPQNGMGWLFLLNGPVGAVFMLGYTYGYRGLAGDPGSVPAGRSAAWLADILAPVVLGLLTVFLFLLFPEGRLRSRAERRTAIGAILGIGLAMAGGIVEPTLFDYEDVPTPLAPAIPPAVSFTLLGLGYSTIFATLAVSIALLVRRLRRAVGRERDQLRLLVWAAVVAAVVFSPSFILPSFIEGYASPAFFLVSGIAVLLVPVSVGVAILRHRLLDIDLVIRRTVVFGLLVAFISIVYVGVVVAIPAAIVGGGGTGFDLLPVVAAAIIAIAFQPVRRRAQRLAGRLVYGDRATPYDVMAELASRMAGTFAADDLSPRIARVLAEGTGAERAVVWLRIGSELRPAGTWPPDGSRDEPAPVPGDRVSELPGTRAVAVRHRDELLGALTIDKPAGEPISETEERLLENVASQAGLALRNVRLTEELRANLDELQASRKRLVRARDEERRRLERDIHDGAQQQLVALAVKVRMAEQAVERDAGRALGILAEVREDAIDALETLRDLARGIYPPVLADEGLMAALRAQARKSPVPVDIRGDGVARHPPEIEATAYFCCLEGLQNAAKYAQASWVDVSLATAHGELVFEVVDDGRGFDPATTPRGSGLQNMADRLQAIGGSLDVHSAPGAGTTLRGRIPVAEVARP